MIYQGFQQTSSFTRTLRQVLVIIAVFFLLGIATTFYTNRGMLQGLQKIHTINRLMNLTRLSLEGLESSEEGLDKLTTGKEINELRYSFHQAHKLTSLQVTQAIELSAEDFPVTKEILTEAQVELRDYELSANELFNFMSMEGVKLDSDEVKSEILVTREFATDAKETLRRAQIKLKSRNDEIFNAIYQSRFFPLVVATALSVLFFAFVILVGLAIARRLARSVGNLGSATGAVSRGDLSYEAPILEQDEFGKLTHEFNGMVDSLRQNQLRLRTAMERVTRLQQITASFSEAMITDEVFDVIFHEAFDTLGVKSGGVAMLDPTGEFVELKRVHGYSIEVQQLNQRYTLNRTFPSVEAIRENRAAYARNPEELQEKYPDISSFYAEAGILSSAAFPLQVEGRAVGAIIFSYGEVKAFDEEELEFMAALVGQCSQAFHRSQLYEAARDAIKVRDEFLSIASHELRTPLTPLKLQLQNLSRQMKKGTVLTPAQLMRSVESSDRQVSRLTTLIDDLLDVSRISAGKLTLNRENFSLAEMIEEVIGQYTQHLREINSTIETDLDRSLTGSFDKVRIEQVLVNLLTNAAKYAPGRPVRVMLRKSGDFARILVKDEGPGIAMENQHRIFDRFERVRDRDNVGGLGLGLYISRQIIEAHEGVIRVESVPGQGSTFIVDLPLPEGKK